MSDTWNYLVDVQSDNHTLYSSITEYLTVTQTVTEVLIQYLDEVNKLKVFFNYHTLY